MDKSPERKALEKDIQDTHDTAMKKTRELVELQFGFCDDDAIEEAMSDPAFVRLMEERISELQKHYMGCYRSLEELEEREGWPAMKAYANRLDYLEQFLPCRRFCHYPFSGVDFYWARVFDRIAFEDMAFDGREHPDNWWDAETYTEKRREEIIALLKRKKIIPENADMRFLAGDAFQGRPDNQFNTLEATLLVKGGHDVLGYVNKRFADEELKYGSVVAVMAANSPDDLIGGLQERGYTMAMAITGTGLTAPFGMDLKDIFIFRRSDTFHPFM